MKVLQLSTLALTGLLVAACATPYRTAGRPAMHPVVHPATKQAAKPAPATEPAEAAATTPAVAVASPGAATRVSAPEAGSAIPFMGFRPMRGQPARGA